MKRPLVSFCIPTYNRAAFIAATIRSVLAQTVQDFEIVVVNDVSPDDTRGAVTTITDSRIRYYENEKNLGVPENLNRALSLARGEFLVLLEDHDLLEADYLEATLGVMHRHPSVGFVATGLVTIDDADRRLQRFTESFPEFMPGKTLLRRLLTRTHCPFSVTTVMRRSSLQSIEPLFDARYWWYADQFLWLRLAAQADFGYIGRPLLRFRTREEDHYLSDKSWESFLCVDRIHKDAWHLLHKKKSVSSLWDRCRYELSKIRSLGGIRLGMKLRREPWTEHDRTKENKYLSFPGRMLLSGAALFPVFFLALLRKMHALYTTKRTSPIIA
jgi:glycosyltransferase involved in cell wall biosynthesis